MKRSDTKLRSCWWDAPCYHSSRYSLYLWNMGLMANGWPRRVHMTRPLNPGADFPLAWGVLAKFSSQP